jgi:hypothetical protein
MKIQTVETCSSSSSINRNFYFKKILKSRSFKVSKWNFKVLSLGSFGQILADFGQFWAVLGRNCCIDNLTVAESLPKVWLKSLKPHNS